MLGVEKAGTRLALPRSDVIDLAAMVICASLLVLAAAQDAGLPRVLLAAAFTLFVPGRAVVTNWPRLAHWSQLGVSVVLSLALLALVATALLWARVWHPVGLFEIEASLSLVALGTGLTRRYRRRLSDGADAAEPRQERGP